MTGLCQCELTNLKVSQNPTGVKIQDAPEYEVTVLNDCICSQLQVKLNCAGFDTTEQVNPEILSKDGDLCLLNNGQPIYGQASFKFKYAWTSSFALTPSSSQISCS